MQINKQHNTITMQDAAKETGIGIRKLYEILRNEKVLYKNESGHHIANDKYIKQGYFYNEFYEFKNPATGMMMPAYRACCKPNGLSLIRELVDKNKQAKAA